jgi:hypothetical protein
MYPDLQKELDTFERRTPKSAEAHKKISNAFRSAWPATIATTIPGPSS